ncbi:MAG: MFS transporter [Maricaulaceae bacterium]
MLFVALMVVGMGNSLLFAVLPSASRIMGAPDAAVGLVYAVSALFYTVMSPVWGRISDRAGRKPILMLGLSGSVISMLGLGLALSAGLAGHLSVAWAILTLALARAVFGMVSSATNPAAQAYVADRTAPEHRIDALAGLTAGFSLGAALGPGAASWIADGFGLASPIFVIAGLLLVAVVMVAVVLPERTEPQSKIGGPGLSSWGLARDRRLRPFLVVGAIAWIVQAVHLQSLNFYIMDRVGAGGRTATELAGPALSAGALALLAAQLVAVPKLKLDARHLMVAGGLATGLASLMMAAASSYSGVVFAFMIASFGFGLSRPGFSSGASLAVEPNEQGGAAGLIAGLAGIGFMTAPLALVWYQAGPLWAPYAACGAALLVATVYAALSPRAARAAARGRPDPTALPGPDRP